MTYTIETAEKQSIDIDDYVDYIASSVDITDSDSVLASAGALRALANNRSFLTRRVNEELADWTTFQQQNRYTAQILTLAVRDGFLVRANIWAPPTGGREWEQDLLSYEVPHDHNFSFLTVGYLGSGYRTKIWEYDPGRVTGYPGERVDLTFLEHTSLPVGKVMYYRASRDVHSQEHPSELSVSLNLMLNGPEAMWGSQYFFDTEASTITSFTQNPTGRRVMLCDLAGWVGDGRTVNLLENLAGQHPAPRIRWSAYSALLTLENDDQQDILAVAMTDEHRYVRARARGVLENEV